MGTKGSEAQVHPGLDDEFVKTEREIEAETETERGRERQTETESRRCLPLPRGKKVPHVTGCDRPDG